MLNWTRLGRHERRMLGTLTLVFRNHPQLLEFLFDRDQPRLRFEPERILVEAGGFSSGEKILVRIGLDLWNGSGGVALWDVIERLDVENYRNVLAGLRNLRRNDPHGEQMVWRQPKRAYYP
jgi:hypothetical protein